MKKTLQSAITTWITAAIILTVGILCIVGQNATNGVNADAYEAISIVLGVTLIVISVLAILLNAFVLRRTATVSTLIDGVILAFGIYLVCQKKAHDILFILTDYAAYIILVLGALFVADAIILCVFGLVKKANLNTFILPVCLEFLIGAVAVVLGALALPLVNVIDKRLTIFGIILIVYAVFLILLGVLTLMGKAVKPIKKDEAIDVEA